MPLGPFQQPNFVVKPFKQDLRTSEGLGVPAASQYPDLPAGQVIQSWLPAGATGAYAVAYDALKPLAVGIQPGAVVVWHRPDIRV